jgi:SNF2 family DNA or RNA helicase
LQFLEERYADANLVSEESGVSENAGTFPYRRPPFAHQREGIKQAAFREYYAWFLQMGLGKTYIEINNAGFLYMKGKIDAVFHVAPVGAHRGFVEDELPEDLPLPIDSKYLLWEYGKMTKTVAGKEKWRDNVKEFFEDRSGKLLVLSINIDSLCTKIGQKLAERFFEGRKVYMAVDESLDIANTGSDRWRACNRFGRRAKFRRILNGSPAPESPMDYYGQMQFLSPMILAQLNKGRPMTKQDYLMFVAETEQLQRGRPIRYLDDGNPDLRFGKIHTAIKRDPITGKKLWRNLDKVKAVVDQHSYRKVKSECLDLPPKVYAKRLFDLTPEQRKMYNDLARQYQTQLPTGQYVYAELAIVRMRRLYQITRGYVGLEGQEARHLIDGVNPAVNTLLQLLREGENQPTIIWTWERMDAMLISRALDELKLPFARYDGSLTEADRARSKAAYLAGDVPNLIAHPMAMGRYHTLNNTYHQIWFANDFKFYWREQGEDRSDRIGLDHSVLITDIIAQDTVDYWKVIPALRDKKDVQEILTGDPKRDWI